MGRGLYVLLWSGEYEDHQLGTFFPPIIASYQQLEGKNLLVIGCHISY
jgi:hypothetical protein